MRLQLTACLLLVSGVVHAQETEPGDGEATTRLLFYGDDDETTVVTSVVDAQVTVPGNIDIGAHALVDVISSASVDVVSAATERWSENRVEFGARVQGELLKTGLSLGYVRSQENDWLSNAVSVGGSRELFERNTVVSASYSFTLNTVGRASDPSFERSLDSHSAELGVSQLVDAKTRVGAAYTAQYLSGYLASPYRFVVATDGTRVPERHPDSRIRHAATGYAVRSLASFLAGRVAYRFYADDWGTRSHTASLRLTLDFSKWWSAGVEGRFYSQNQADFYRGVYDTSYRYMSFDRELSSFWDAGGIANLSMHLGPVVVDAKGGLIYYDFANFPALPNRVAMVAGGGAKINW